MQDFALVTITMQKGDFVWQDLNCDNKPRARKAER